LPSGPPTFCKCAVYIEPSRYSVILHLKDRRDHVIQIPDRSGVWTPTTHRADVAGHTKWECKYHVIFIPEKSPACPETALEVFRKLAEQNESRIEEGRLLAGRV
jgi:putative transposase